MENLSAEPLATPRSVRTGPVEMQHHSPQLASRIQRGILRLAPGRIRELRVEVRNQSVILTGRCANFYCKQLAQHAAMDLVSGLDVENRIVVDG